MTFFYEAMFTYEGSADNRPVENVGLRFPCPNVENEAVTMVRVAWVSELKPDWGLYWLDNENVLQLQQTELGMRGLLGDRAESGEGLEVSKYGPEQASVGPMFTYHISELYPREVLRIQAYALAPEASADDVTLQICGDEQGRSDGYWYHPAEWPIDLSFWVQLSKKTNDNFEVVETFGRSRENAPAGYWFWLYSY